MYGVHYGEALIRDEREEGTEDKDGGKKQKKQHQEERGGMTIRGERKVDPKAQKRVELPPCAKRDDQGGEENSNQGTYPRTELSKVMKPKRAVILKGNEG